MRKAQVVICKCGSIVAACMEPHCYEDAEWQRDIRKYSKEGYEIGMVSPEQVRLKLSECKCEVEQTALAI